MNPLNVLNYAVQGVYHVAKEIPNFTYSALVNVTQGCLEGPKTIPVFVTSLALANGGFIAAYKCGKKALETFKKGEILQGTLYTGAVTAAGTASLIGGISTSYLIFLPHELWKNRDFKVITGSAELTADFYRHTSLFLFENALMVPQWIFEFGKFFVERSIEHPAAAVSYSFSAGLSMAGAVVSFRYSKQAIQALREGNYSKAGVNVALTGLASSITAIISVSSCIFLLDFALGKPE